MQAEIQKFLKRHTHRLLLTRVVESAVLIATIATACCSFVMLMLLVMQLTLPFPLWILPALTLLVGAFVGAIFSLLRGATAKQTAIFLDAKYQLCEKLSTAAELAEQGDKSSAGLCVYAQATSAAEQIQARPDFRKNPPAITIALVLGIMFCGLLLLIPGREQKPALNEAGDIKQIVAAMNEISPTMRNELAKAITDVPTSDEKILAELKALSLAIITKDQVEQQRILASLAQAGYRPIASLPANLQRELAQGGADKIANGPPQDESPDRELIPADSKVIAEPRPVRVYHPDYADTSKRSAVEPPKTSYHPTPTDPAWSATKARAAQTARTPSEKLPQNYRPIIRRFYQQK